MVKVMTMRAETNANIPLYTSRVQWLLKIITGHGKDFTLDNNSTMDPNCNNTFIGPNEYESAELDFTRPLYIKGEGETMDKA